MQKMVKTRMIFCFVAERFSFLVLKYPGQRYKMKIIRDTKLASRRNRGTPSEGIRPMKLDRIDSPSSTGSEDWAKDMKKFDEEE